MSASSPNTPVSAPELEVDTDVGTLTSSNTATAAASPRFYREQRKAELEALNKANKALEDAEEAQLKIKKTFCFCRPGQREKIRIADLHVHQAQRTYSRIIKRLESLDRMEHEWNLSHDANERSSQEKVNKLVRTLSTTSPSAADPWESKLPNPTRPKDLRERSARHYDYCETKASGGIIAKCCLTGIIGDRNVVTNAHLLPRNAPAHFLDELGFKDVDDIRNMVILCNNIDKAFEEKRLCFLADENRPRSFVLKIWDEKIKDKLVFNGDAEHRTIGSYSGRSMIFAEGKTPFSRVLSLHAQCSYETAKKNNWINVDEPKPNEYGTPLQDDFLSFRKLGERCSPETTIGISTTSDDNWVSPRPIDSRITDQQQSSNREGTGSLHSVSESKDYPGGTIADEAPSFTSESHDERIASSCKSVKP